MNGRMAKQLRRVAANPTIPAETEYKAIQHQRVANKPVTDKLGIPAYKDGKPVYEKVGIIRIQVILGNCQRNLYKTWKARYKHFTQSSNTLPHVGLTKRMGG